MKRLMVVVVLAACAGCCSWESRGTHVTVDTTSGMSSIEEHSYRLANRIRVSHVTYDNATDGIRRATVTLTSLLKRRQRLQARMIWLDSEGVEVDADAKPFRAIVLDGEDTTTFTGIAPNPKVVKARLIVREMDTVE